MSTFTRAAFTEEHARRLASQAAVAIGLDASGVELIRIGEHAMFRLGGGVVARVARGPGWRDTAAREIQVAGLLHAHGVPCGLPALVEEPVLVAGHPVTFWEELDTSHKASFADIGGLLAALHAVPVPAGLDIPALDALHRVADRINAAPISVQDKDDLTGVLAQLTRDWAALYDSSDLKLIHGDPHSGNIAFAQGRPVLIDLETVCLGPVAWDLALPATYYASLGWIDEGTYAGFVAAYGGADVTQSPQFRVLRRIRELRMTSWLAQHAAESAQTAAQVRHRIACLVDDDLPRVWSRR